MSLAPKLGGTVSKQQQAKFELLDHYENGKFLNEEPINIPINFSTGTKMMTQFIKPNPNVRPKKDLDVQTFDVSQLHKNLGEDVRITWLGHSSILMEIQDQTILIDPIFSDFVAPYEFLGKKSFREKMPFQLEDLKTIDALIISHDHYDHLDYETIIEIKDKIKHVIVPLGVGNHFEKWGVSKEHIQELDWWEETNLNGIKIACTPSRHSSGRSITDQSATLWSSWCFIGKHRKIYFSGDGGYGKHFKQIGEKYGSFHFGMIECGQYDDLWADVHMKPEESVQAGIDVQAQAIMPIHWGSFVLANHDWNEPPKRFSTEAMRLGKNYVIPRIGESILVNDDEYISEEWWRREF